MAFKLTYSDGQETDYDDGTVWEVDNGVLKMGREDGEWTVLVSPSHWAVIEVGGAAPPKGEGEDADDDSKSDEDDQDDQDDKDDGAKDDKDDKDDKDEND
jgi:hypothetical protein